MTNTNSIDNRIYILQKDLPDAKAGTELKFDGDRFYDYYNGTKENSFWDKKFVENNPDWFKLKEQEDKIPADARNIEVFHIDRGRAYIGFKISNGNFEFIHVPYNPDASKAPHQYPLIEKESIPTLDRQEKPPLGIVPEFIWKEQRLSDINAAIKRYLTGSQKPIPVSWIAEQNELEQWIENREEEKLKRQPLPENPPQDTLQQKEWKQNFGLTMPQEGAKNPDGSFKEPKPEFRHPDSKPLGIEIVTHRDRNYPKFQTNGNSARFCMPFAKEVCKGTGFDIGYSREEWKFPGAIGIEPSINPEFHATNLPDGQVDYIFSAHCLEHTYNWVDCLDYWATKIKPQGVLFLYLPDYSQTYWRPYSNRKHIHSFTPEIIRDYLEQSGLYKNIFVSGVDAYNSFTAFAERKF